MKTRKVTKWIWLMLPCFTALIASAAIIDFEQINGAMPCEGMAISNQFQAYFGISFRRGPGASFPWPWIARIGEPSLAFGRNGNNPSDTVISAYTTAVGQFFLADGGGDFNLVLDFSAPVSQASGYILDIDSTEQVTVSAYADGTTTNALESRVFASGDPQTGDGVGTFWSFNHTTNDILRIELAAHDRPVGYDRFSSNYAPPPANAATIGLRMYPGLTINGDVGRPYRIEYANGFDMTPISTNWHTLTNIFLPTSPYLFYDSSPASSAGRFYRAVGLQ